MRNRWARRLFPLVAVLLLAPWPVAYAYGFDGETAAGGRVYVEAPQREETVAWTAFQNAVGSVDGPVDLFYIDAAGSRENVEAALYMTNAGDLSSHYRYMILEVGIYTRDSNGEWALLPDAQQDIFLTLENARAVFSLPGNARYRVAVNSGSYYLAGRAAGDISPRFYLSVD